MKTEKMKVLLYLKKSCLDKSGKAPIMGRITIGRSIAQFSCKLSCNPDLWNPRESRMDGKSSEAVEINGRLENLLLSIQSAYQSLIAKDQPFDAAHVEKPLYFDPFGQIEFAPVGHNIIAPCKVLVQGSILFYPFRDSGFS